MIQYEDFQKLDLRIAKILEAERVEDSEKLLRLQVNVGSEPSTDSTGSPQAASRQGQLQIIAGIGKAYKPEDLIGREIVIIANLELRMIMGLESHGMLLAAGEEDGPVLLQPDKDTTPGAKIH